MSQKIKIVHILCHPPNPVINNINKPENYFVSKNQGEFIRIPENPFWIGFFNGDHHVVAAKELLNLTDAYDVECWRPYGDRINKIYSKKVDGIMHRVFPSWSIKITHFGQGNFSPSLLKFLINYVKDNQLILNISVGHAWFNIWLLLRLRKLKNKIPVIALHRSGGFKKFNYQQLTWFKKLFKWHYLIEHYLDIKSLKYVDHYLSGSLVEANYMKTLSTIKSSYFMEGVDFNVFKPVLDKAQIRKELELPVDKIIMIVTGNFRSTDYGYHHLLECFKRMKEKHDDLLLIMAGGYKHEDLYEAGKNTGAIMVERIPKELLLKYYQASDFYGQPSFHYTFVYFGGFGTAMIEALACGLPIISQNIIHFPGTLDERNEIGLDMPTIRDLEKNIIFLKENYHKYKRTRKIANKYFDIENTKLVLLDYYNQLSKQYYSN